MERKAFYILFVGLLLIFSKAAAQSLDMNKEWSEEDLASFRRHFIQQVVRYAPTNIHAYRSADHKLQVNSANRLMSGLQLNVVHPNYVPFTIAPPYSSMAGAGSENPYSGFTPYRLNGNIMIMPQDRTNGWGRVGLGMMRNWLGQPMLFY